MRAWSRSSGFFGFFFPVDCSASASASRTTSNGRARGSAAATARHRARAIVVGRELRDDRARVRDLDAIRERELHDLDEERAGEQRPPRDAPRLARKPHAFPKMREGLVDPAEPVLGHGEQLQRRKQHDRAVELPGDGDRAYERRARILVLAPREQDHGLGRERHREPDRAWRHERVELGGSGPGAIEVAACETGDRALEELVRAHSRHQGRGLIHTLVPLSHRIRSPTPGCRAAASAS